MNQRTAPPQPPRTGGRNARLLLGLMVAICCLGLAMPSAAAREPDRPAPSIQRDVGHRGDSLGGHGDCAGPPASAEHSAVWLMRDGFEPGLGLVLDELSFDLDVVIDDARTLDTISGQQRSDVRHATYDAAATTASGDPTVAGSLTLFGQAEIQSLPGLFNVQTIGAAGYRFGFEILDDEGATLHLSSQILASQHTSGDVVVGPDARRVLVIDDDPTQTYELDGDAGMFGGVVLDIPLGPGEHIAQLLVFSQLSGLVPPGEGIDRGAAGIAWSIHCNDHAAGATAHPHAPGAQRP